MKKITTLSVFLFASFAIAGEADDFAFFESKVRPILIDHCYSCHAKDAKKIRGELLLDSKEGWMKGGESGQIIIPGNPEKSLFVKVLSYNDTIQMPPKGKLADKDIAILTEWVKRGALGSQQALFSSTDGSSNTSVLQFTSGDQLEFYEYTSGSYAGQKITTAVYRDPSAWYHVVAVRNTTSGTASERMRLYVNGVEVTTFSTNTNPSQNADSRWNSTAA
ncbi:hypothetical protein EBX93_09000, partial [bacterium]|nr:hypothetical protein [bacterium]